MEDERLLDTLSKSCYASKSYSFLRGEKASELRVSIKRGVLVGALDRGFYLKATYYLLIVLFSNQIQFLKANRSDVVCSLAYFFKNDNHFSVEFWESKNAYYLMKKAPTHSI